MTAASTRNPPLPLPGDALAELARRLLPVGCERVPLVQAMGRVLAEPLRADRPSPPCDTSAMDGYALRLADLKEGCLPVSSEVALGQEPPVLQRGTAVRIFTGGAVPSAAEVIIKREDLKESADAIEIPAHLTAKPGMNIRRRGENVAEGAVIVEAGTLITPATLAALAAFGVAEPKVHQRVRVAVIVTGDELLPVEAAILPWQIRDSNGLMLAGFLGRAPWLEVVGHHRVADRFEVLCETLASSLGECDAVLLTGGVSMGDHDHVPAAVQAVGGNTVFHKLAQRPGKPMLGAIGPTGQAILGLPGNPVSAMVTARRWGSMALRKRGGMADADPSPASVMLVKSDGKSLGMLWHRPVRMVGPGRAELAETMGSGDLVSAARSDGFVEVAPNATGEGPWPFYSWDW